MALITKDAFNSAYKKAPRAVQNAIQSEHTSQVVGRIRTTYNLHVDTAGTVSAQVGYMLLGLLDPRNFYENLLGLGIDPKDVTAITQEINKEIFLPLQNQIKSGARDNAEDEDDEPEGVYDPSLFQTETAAAPLPEPSPQVPVMHIEAAPVAAPVVQPPSSPTPSYNLVPEYNPPASSPAPTMRTMEHDMELVQQGSTPTPYVSQSAVPHSSQSTPARMFQTASVPVTSAPQPLAEQPVHVIPDTRPQLPQRPVPQIAPVREVSSDPYRESI